MADAYGASRQSSNEQAILGMTVLFAGVAGVLSAIVLTTTPVSGWYGLGEHGARHVAGVLAGIGMPAIIAGLVTVLPTGPRDQWRAAIGIGISLLGVVLFWTIYPQSWLVPDRWYLTAGVTGIYAIGGFLGLWSVLAALATFRQRNNPGGTVTLEVVRAGETRTIEVSEAEFERRDVASIVSERTES